MTAVVITGLATAAGNPTRVAGALERPTISPVHAGLVIDERRQTTTLARSVGRGWASRYA
jgi:hypothetical protein